MKPYLILCFSLLICSSVHSTPTDDFLGTRPGYIGGKSYDFNLSAKALSNAPQWKDGDPYPPLPPLKAREIALKKAKELCPSVKNWKADRIILEHIPNITFEEPMFWIYEVRCEDFDGIIEGIPPYLEIPVMMNGVAVDPLINAKSINGVPTK